ncbi:hypothetical protein A2442_01870 [Candidatus Campbellbacteria bacterium RIFOXYC2_FULL_35_25]|uniref:Uncharacterized protein n=1 Tax=Candidatus Campbellbacteria bacterium RIFOXYC2_FULL_35_25 TaxID=1797582 RepID=A0A1F5EIT8_9BACT|nr:MAG: hypothetical protein A2442_01870 [Candidatus Campbellbacteria bacterium RIFOXYC2_FULL_35_25]
MRILLANSQKEEAMKYGNLNLGQIEALVNKLGGMNAVTAILQGAMKEAVTVVSYITHTFTILVDETKTVEELVVEGNYDWSDSNVTSKNFPRSEEGTKDKKEVALFHFNKTMTSEDVIAEMKKDGYRPATIFELLALGVTQPELQRGFPIIALGSDCTFDGSRHVAYLYESAGGRNLHLLWLDNDWNDYCRFVGLRR